MKLLVSVKNLTEAQFAVDANTDIVDVKEPANGPLGRADPGTLQTIGKQFGGRASLSAALGELVDYESSFAMQLSGFDFFKLGLAHWTQPGKCFEQLARELDSSPPHLSPVVVSYLDFQTCGAPDPAAIVDWAIGQRLRQAHSLKYFLFDTYSKSPGADLFHFVAASQLKLWIQDLHQHGFQVAVAGSVKQKQIGSVQQTGADIVGVRGAICGDGMRDQSIDLQRIAMFKCSIEACVTQGPDYVPSG